MILTLFECDAMLSGRLLTIFWRNRLLLSLVQKRELSTLKMEAVCWTYFSDYTASQTRGY
jgi:hypothetical protein